MAKHNLIINKEKCIGCMKCINDCVSGNLSLDKENKVQVNGSSCLYCGHCEAICPNNAIVLDGFEDETIEYEEQTRLDPNDLLMAVRTRRSIRKFIDKPIEESIVNQILEVGRITPTAVNSQKIRYIILGDKQDELEVSCVKYFRRLSKLGKPFSKAVRNLSFSDNFFFKGAPLVIVIVADKVNGCLAASNMALMAESFGLGVLYSGMFTSLANIRKSVKKTLKLKSKEKVATTLVIGYTNIKYKRTVKREKLNVIKL